METIRRPLFTLLFVFIIGNAFGQDQANKKEIDKKINETKELPRNDKMKEAAVDEYYTEVDYNLKYNIDTKKKNKSKDAYEVDEHGEVIAEKKRGKKSRDGGFFNDEGVEAVIDVVVNVAFVMLLFWQ